MRRRRLLAALLLQLVSLASPAGFAQDGRTPAVFGFVSLKDDPRHGAFEIYANLVLRPRVRPVDGARTAIRDARIVGRALEVDFSLAEAEVAAAEEVPAAVDRLASERGARFVLLDLPAPAVAAAARATRGKDLLLLNVSAGEDELRGEFCAPHLLHVVPSRAMLADALGQYAGVMQWRRVLIVAGPEPADEALGLGYARAIRRFGGKVVDVRRFAANNDPRQREQNNVRLLTQGMDYDAVLVADTKADFGRRFPYQTVLPRPVVGSVGLVPAAWHWTFERHGAPQLNQRFERHVEGQRHMADAEFAAWAAVRAVVEAYGQTRSTDFGALRDALRDGRTTFDVYKGNPASFRPWDNQLRQPILLHTGDAVTARAPFEGFLHERNVLDTLGVDLPQTRCRF